jgi:hypothetical protein
MKTIILTFALLFALSNVIAQVGIGTNSPNSCAALEIKDTARGLLIPKMTMVQKNAIVNPVEGLMIYQTDSTKGFWYYNKSGQWKSNGVSDGTTPGEMLYWDGIKWMSVPVGLHGQGMFFCNGVPTWGGCKPLVTTSAITNITYSNAGSGGNISSDGGNIVTARGIVWDTSHSPTISLTTKTSDSSGTGTFTSSISGLNYNTTYYVRAYATNKWGTAYGDEVSFTTPAPSIGDNFQGGRVAYILQPSDPSYITGQIHGLIAAPGDQSISATWGCWLTTVGASGTAIGTGNQNTITIVTVCTTTGIAAEICNDLVLNGYSDWYLPSKDELFQLFTNQTAIGGFAAQKYWCSSEYDLMNGWKLNFGNGAWSSNSSKSNGYYVRAIRSF